MVTGFLTLSSFWTLSNLKSCSGGILLSSLAIVLWLRLYISFGKTSGGPPCPELSFLCVSCVPVGSYPINLQLASSFLFNFTASPRQYAWLLWTLSLFFSLRTKTPSLSWFWTGFPRQYTSSLFPNFHLRQRGRPGQSCLHVFPQDIVSDLGPHFHLKFGKPSAVSLVLECLLWLPPRIQRSSRKDKHHFGESPTLHDYSTFGILEFFPVLSRVCPQLIGLSHHNQHLFSLESKHWQTTCKITDMLVKQVMRIDFWTIWCY